MQFLPELCLLSLAIIAVFGQLTKGNEVQKVKSSNEAAIKSNSFKLLLRKIKKKPPSSSSLNSKYLTMIKEIARTHAKKNKPTADRAQYKLGPLTRDKITRQHSSSSSGFIPQPISNPYFTNYSPEPLPSPDTYQPQPLPNPGTNQPQPHIPLPHTPLPYEPLPNTPLSHMKPSSPHLENSYLANEEYQDIWLNMLQEIYTIMEDKQFFHNMNFVPSIFNKLRYLMNEINVIDDHDAVNTLECPDHYTKSGSLCLLADHLSKFLSYDDARTYCKTIHGGDLAIFRDANEFYSIQKFIRQIDSRKVHSYWIGASDELNEGDWRFLDGRAVPYYSPYWGTYTEDCASDGLVCRMQKGRSPRHSGAHSIHPFKGPESEDEDYAVLNKNGLYYMHSADNQLAEEWNTVPLCHYIPERDQNNLQYVGEGINEDLNDLSYFRTTFYDDYISAHLPHKHPYRGR